MDNSTFKTKARRIETSPEKILSMSMEVARFITHSGRFHADEVMAAAILSQADIISDVLRITPEVLPLVKKEGDIVGDIGRIYSPHDKIFDHHQGKYPRPDGSYFATAGMIWTSYAKQAIRMTIPFENVTEEMVDFIFQRVDRLLIKGIDANDTDNDFDKTAKCVSGEVNVVTLSDIVRSMNQKDIYSEGQKKWFFQAVHLCKLQLQYFINGSLAVYLAKDKIRACEVINNTLIMDEGFAWKEAICDPEFKDILYVISKSDHPSSDYMLIAVPLEAGKRAHKKDIERSPEFKDFIHEGKWIAGGSKEDLLKLAEYNVK